MRAGSKEEKIVIEISHLVKKYGDHIAVNDLTLTVEPGKIYGFLGPNGAEIHHDEHYYRVFRCNQRRGEDQRI